MVRQPAVAGQFYPGGAQRLESEVAGMTSADGPPVPAIGIVVPHAGYVYSGAVAGRTFASVEVPGSAVVLGPNHTGLGAAVALWGDGSWALPGREVPVDAGLAAAIRARCPMVRDDRTAHLFEHSLEVQVPFLAHRNPEIAIVPLCLGRLGAGQCRELGAAIAEAIRSAGRPILVVASSDMTHYETDESARRKDRLAIERMLALDPDGLLATVAGHDISMCGVIPAAVMLFAALGLGATAADLVAYATSGETSGDWDQVVGYAGIAVR